jgi:hypothetical protein
MRRLELALKSISGAKMQWLNVEEAIPVMENGFSSGNGSACC